MSNPVFNESISFSFFVLVLVGSFSNLASQSLVRVRPKYSNIVQLLAFALRTALSFPFA